MKQMISRWKVSKKTGELKMKWKKRKVHGPVLIKQEGREWK